MPRSTTRGLKPKVDVLYSLRSGERKKRGTVVSIDERNGKTTIEIRDGRSGSLRTIPLENVKIATIPRFAQVRTLPPEEA